MKRLIIEHGGRVTRHDLGDKPVTIGRDPESDIFLVAADGSSGSAIVEHPANDELLGWSPDGRQLPTELRRLLLRHLGAHGRGPADEQDEEREVVESRGQSHQ